MLKYGDSQALRGMDSVQCGTRERNKYADLEENHPNQYLAASLLQFSTNRCFQSAQPCLTAARAAIEARDTPAPDTLPQLLAVLPP